MRALSRKRRTHAEWNATMTMETEPTPTSDDRGRRIREIWPTVKRFPAVANLGKFLNNTIVFAPLGWLVMSGVYFGKVLPIIGIRYRLTDKRIMILRGWKGSISQQVLLTDIDDVQLDP